MAKNREGSIDLFGAIQAKTEDGIVVHADGIAVEYDENGKPTKTLEQAIADGSLGGGNKKTNRPVPNTGTLDKVYFNTSLNVEEVVKIINQLEFHTYQNQTIYTLFIAGNKAIHIFKTAENTYTIMSIMFELYWTNVPEMNVPVGWQSFENPINCENNTLESENDGTPRGEQNDKLSQLISIDPFINSSPLEVIDVEELPSATIEVEGTEIPSSGQVGKVYFNTKLSVEEVNEILGSLEYVEGVLTFPAVAVATTADMSSGLVVGRFEFENIVAYIIESSKNGESTRIYDSISNTPWETKTGFEEYNIENMLETIASMVGMTIQNDKLKQLISITPFEEPNPDIQLDKLYRTPIKDGGEWSGTVVPNTGTVEKVYFNTELSDEEIESILSTLTYDSQGREFILVAGSINNPSLGILIFGDATQEIYGIADMMKMKAYWANQKCVDQLGSQFGVTTAGWQEFDNPIEVNSEVISSDATDNATATMFIGTQNDKLSQLISTTPFTQSDIGAEVVGYKYNQFVDGEWKELGNGGGSGGISKEEVNTLISEYMSANYDNLDEEEF